MRPETAILGTLSLSLVAIVATLLSMKHSTTQGEYSVPPTQVVTNTVYIVVQQDTSVPQGTQADELLDMLQEAQ